MPFQIIRSDITRVKADAIVNTANPQPGYAAGTDYAVYQAAGAEQLLAARRGIGAIAPGQAAVTPAFALPAKYIIHTVGPAWTGGANGEFDTLRACYGHSLALAAHLKCESIAFPLIATGVYGFPKDAALRIAMDTIRTFLNVHEMDVTLVVFDQQSFVLSGGLTDEVRELISAKEARERADWEYAERSCLLRGRRPLVPMSRHEEVCDAMPLEEIQACECTSMPAPKARVPQQPMAAPAAPKQAPMSLDDLLKQKGETFEQRLLHLIDARGMTDVEVYKRANLDRKHFSKIRCNPAYHPKKKTALALAVALRLTVEETKDLLARAGIALSDASTTDIIVLYYIGRGKYDVYDINVTLFDYEQEGLGA